MKAWKLELPGNSRGVSTLRMHYSQGADYEELDKPGSNFVP